MVNLVDQREWDLMHRDGEFLHLAKDDLFRRWIEAFVPRGSGDCLEIGCFPGRFLAAIGDLGYRLHGIDLAPRTEIELPRWLAAEGYRVGDFVRGDFFAHRFAQRFDVVSSFGFVEHFTNWQDVLGLHAELVAPGGYLVVEAPNMAGLIQRTLRHLFDPEDLARHHTPAMHTDFWAAVAHRLGFEVLFAGPISTFAFWGNLPVQGAKARLADLLRALGPILALRPETGSNVSAGFVGLVARRSSDGISSRDQTVAADLQAIAVEAASHDRQIAEASAMLVKAVDDWCATVDGKRP